MRIPFMLLFSLQLADYSYTIQRVSNLVATVITEHKTGICINDNIPSSKKTIPMVTGHFHEVIQKSKYFIDKSMLIQQVLENCKKGTVKAITLPRKWGKSFNLNMVRFFIQKHENGSQIPTNETPSYKFFAHGIIPETGHRLNAPPLISKEKKLIEKHLGRHHVIYIDFGRIQALEPTFQSLFDEFRKEMARIFSEHKYVTEIWNGIIENENATVLEKTEAKLKLQFFDNILLEKESQKHQVIKAIIFLADALVQFAGKTPIILFDEYDKFANIVYFSKTIKFSAKDKKLATNFTDEFTQITFHRTDLFDVAIVTGILRISEVTFTTAATNIMEYNILHAKELYPFYGFSTEEVLLLLKQRQVENEQKKVTEWYHGYKFLDHPAALYAPWAIVNYINKIKIDDYWVKSGSTAFLRDLCRYGPIRELFESLIVGKRFPVNETGIVPSPNEFEIIRELTEGNVEDGQINTTGKHVLIAVLFNAGYLTLTNDSTTSNIQLKFTNMEVSHFIATKLLEFYKTYLNYDIFHSVIKISESLNDLIQKDSHDVLDDMKTTFRQIRQFQIDRAEGKQNDSLILGQNQHLKSEIMHHTIFIPALMLHERYKYKYVDNEALINDGNRMNIVLEKNDSVVLKIIFKYSDDKNITVFTYGDVIKFKKNLSEEVSIKMKYVTVRVDSQDNMEFRKGTLSI